MRWCYARMRLSHPAVDTALCLMSAPCLAGLFTPPHWVVLGGLFTLALPCACPLLVFGWHTGFRCCTLLCICHEAASGGKAHFRRKLAYLVGPSFSFRAPARPRARSTWAPVLSDSPWSQALLIDFSKKRLGLYLPQPQLQSSSRVWVEATEFVYRGLLWHPQWVCVHTLRGGVVVLAHIQMDVCLTYGG